MFPRKRGLSPVDDDIISLVPIEQDINGVALTAPTHDHPIGCGTMITATTPILIRYPTGLLDYLNVEDIATLDYGICVWSDFGFTKLHRIVKHSTTDKICRILTHNGCISTVSSSILAIPDGSDISVSNVSVGDLLLHTGLPQPTTSAPMTDSTITRIACYYSMGFFYGDGSCGQYGTDSSNIKSTWALNNTNLKFLRRAQKELNETYSQFVFKIYDTLESSGVYKLACTGDGMYMFVQHWRRLFYTQRKQKRVPMEILNASIGDVTLFMEGYYDADGDKDINGYRRFDNKGEIGAAGLLYLSFRMGYNTSINTRHDKPSIFRITCTKSTQRKIPTAIKRIEDFGTTSDPVYTIQTENKHVSVGVGKIVVNARN